KASSRCLRIQKTFVHTHVDDLCTAFHLVARDTQCFSYWPLKMNFANFGEPVTFVRSPMLTKLRSGRNVRASKPLRRRYGSGCGGLRGFRPRTASATARICSGVVPQHPPTIFTQPFAAKSRRMDDVSAAVSS